jgi:hypothetical protein
MEDIIIGVDLAKRIFQLHGATGSGELIFRKRLTRDQFWDYMSRQPPSSVVFEACGSSSYWAREMHMLGHEVRLIAPQYVKPFVKRQKNDATDAEAIVVAARQPEMRFVSPKSEEQQARAAIFRARERLVRQRTELMNAWGSLSCRPQPNKANSSPYQQCGCRASRAGRRGVSGSPVADFRANSTDRNQNKVTGTCRREQRDSPPFADDAPSRASKHVLTGNGSRTNDGSCCRSICAGHYGIPMWP